MAEPGLSAPTASSPAHAPLEVPAEAAPSDTGSVAAFGGAMGAWLDSSAHRCPPLLPLTNVPACVCVINKGKVRHRPHPKGHSRLLLLLEGFL